MTRPLLEVEALTVRYGGAQPVVAVADCTLSVNRGEIFALVGESGSGKSTLARAVAGLVRPAAGHVRLDGLPIASQSRACRRRIQMVFQDPDASLNPYLRVRTTLAEPLRVLGLRDERALQARVEALAAMVRLDPPLLERKPRELSGGQKQRVAIARALAMEPHLLIADEALSALDVATQQAIGTLLFDLSRQLSLAILFISHDLLMVRHLAGRIAIMRAGAILDMGDVAAVFDRPSHDYTRLLLAATPDLARGGIDLSENWAPQLQGETR